MSNATKLPNSEREQNYRRQNAAGHGKNKLSNRQKRRLKRHDNLAKIQQVAKATFKAAEEKPAPTEPEITLSEPTNDVVMNSIDLPEQPWETNSCPRCGAKGDEPCTTPKGTKAAKPHAGRETA